jgi:hypothetical protein
VGLVEQGGGMRFAPHRIRGCGVGVAVIGLVLGSWLAIRSNRIATNTIGNRIPDRSDSSAMAVSPESGHEAEPFATTLARVVAAGGETIRLEAGDVSDSQIVTLANVERLRVVRVRGGMLSGSAGRALASMPHLEQLHLRDVELSDESLAALAQSRSLWLLNLVGRGFTHIGIERLVDLRMLRQLRLGMEGGDNRVAEAIAKITSLRSVHLIGCGTTDQGLMALAGLPRLQSLYLDDCQISDQAWTWLFENQPQLHVHIDQGHHDRDPGRHRHATTKEGQGGVP